MEHRSTQELQDSSETLGRVLLVADDESQLSHYAFLMRALRFECDQADSAREATQLAETSEPNLIFIDIADPELAVETSRRLQRYFQQGCVPILVALHPSDGSPQRQAAEAGADDFIVYPTDDVELIFKLRTMMRQAHKLQELDQRATLLDGLLRRHVGGPLVDHWLATGTDGGELSGQTVEVSVLFADIVAFTRMSSEWPAQQTVEMLNEILTLCTLPLVDYGGTIDKYIGDCVMAYFGPSENTSDHAGRAVQAGRAMQKALSQWVAYQKNGLAQIGLSVGINTGTVVLGNMGSSLRLDHTVIGDAVNVAARLQDLAPDGGIYAGPDTVAATQGRWSWSSQGMHSLRGRTGEIEVFAMQEALVPAGT